MKAAVYDRYGPPEVIEIRDVPVPVPAAGQLLVKVAAAALNPKDAITRAGRFKRLAGPRFPKFMGYDFAGTVTALGPGIQGYKPGDAVFGMLNGWRAGCCAEYLVADAEELCKRPLALGFIEAASLPLAAQTALQALRDLGGVGEGSRVLIHGASGGVGTLAVQIAKALGAHVTALCGRDSADLVRGLGADEVLDYRVTPPADLHERYDCFFDVFGNQSLGSVRHLLTPRGRYVSTVPNARNIRDTLLTRFWPGKRGALVVVKSKAADLRTLARWVGAGSLKPVIAQVLPLSEIRRAHELIQTKRTHGKIVLTP